MDVVILCIVCEQVKQARISQVQKHEIIIFKCNGMWSYCEKSSQK